MERPELSLVVPVMNDAPIIAELVQRSIAACLVSWSTWK